MQSLLELPVKLSASTTARLTEQFFRDKSTCVQSSCDLSQEQPSWIEQRPEGYPRLPIAPKSTAVLHVACCMLHVAFRMLHVAFRMFILTLLVLRCTSKRSARSTRSEASARATPTLIRDNRAGRLVVAVLESGFRNKTAILSDHDLDQRLTN